MKLITKSFGFALLFIGITIILYALLSSYNIFTAKSPVPEIFPVPEITIEDSSSPIKTATSIQDIQDQLQETMKEQMGSMLPPDFIPKLLNLISWSIFATILIFGGTHISGIGIKLIKD